MSSPGAGKRLAGFAVEGHRTTGRPVEADGGHGVWAMTTDHKRKRVRRRELYKDKRPAQARLARFSER